MLIKRIHKQFFHGQGHLYKVLLILKKLAKLNDQFSHNECFPLSLLTEGTYQNSAGGQKGLSKRYVYI